MRYWILFWAMISGPILSLGQGTVSLLENSPFLPPATADGGNGSGNEEGDSPLALLQLRGITSIEGEYIFSIFDPSTRQSKWIRQGEQADGLTIRSYNPVANTVMIHSQSEDLSRQLELNVSAAPSPITVPTAAATPAGATQPTTGPRDTSAAAARASRTVNPSMPSRRNLEILRERRQALADQLRQQSNPGSAPSNNSSQGRGTGRSSNPQRR